MNDGIPGSSYYNPIWYKKYRIFLSDMYNIHGFNYEYVHDSYDGAEDSGDNRYGWVHTVDQAKAEIDEREDN